MMMMMMMMMMMKFTWHVEWQETGEPSRLQQPSLGLGIVEIEVTVEGDISVVVFVPARTSIFGSTTPVSRRQK